VPPIHHAAGRDPRASLSGATPSVLRLARRPRTKDNRTTSCAECSCRTRAVASGASRCHLGSAVRVRADTHRPRRTREELGERPPRSQSLHLAEPLDRHPIESPHRQPAEGRRALERRLSKTCRHKRRHLSPTPEPGGHTPQTRKVAPLLASASRSATTRLSLRICELRLPPMVAAAAPTAGIIRTGNGVEVFVTLRQLDHRTQHREHWGLIAVLAIHLVRRRHRRLSSLGFRPHFNTKRVAFLRTQGPWRCPGNSHSECST